MLLANAFVNYYIVTTDGTVMGIRRSLCRAVLFLPMRAERIAGKRKPDGNHGSAGREVNWKRGAFANTIKCDRNGFRQKLQGFENRL